jgi:hypothetical protein
MVNYHIPCHQGASPQTARRWSHQVPTYSLIQRGSHPPGRLGWGPWMHNRIQWGAGTSEGRGALLIRFIRTEVQIQACPRRQKGRLITSQWDTLVTSILGMKPCLSGSGSGMGELCCVRIYKNVSWDTAHLRSEWEVPSHSASVWQQEEICGSQSKNTPLECMISNFKKGFNGDYGVNS